LAEGTIELPEGFNDSDTANKQVMVFYRQAGSERLLVVHNVSAKQSTHTIKHAIKRPIADMNKVKIESKSDAEHVLTMPAYSSIIIEL
jgi:glycosidase